MSKNERKDSASEGDQQNSERSTTTTGEAASLLRSSSAADSEVASSTRSVESSGGNYFSFSSHWMNTANLDNKELFRSERDRAVEKGIVKAAFLIRDAVLGDSENPSMGTYDPYENPEHSVRNLLSLVFRQILSHRSIRQISNAVVWTVALLTFVEPPRWCRDGYNGDETQTCQVLFDMRGPAAGSEALLSDNTNNTTANISIDGYVEYYPSTNSLLLTREQSNIIEWICISIFSLRILLLIGRDGCSLPRFLRRGPAQVIRLLQLLAIGSIVLGLWFDYTLFQPFARLILLGTILRTLHQELHTTLQILPQVMNIFFMMFIYMIFWAFLGTVMFYDMDEGRESFSNLIESLWTLWICVTTANYPDVMMPAYNQNRFVAIYFVIFMIFTFFFFANLIQASVVNTYDDVMTKRRKDRRKVEDAKLTEAFQLMDKAKTGDIDRETVLTLFRILNKDFPEFRHISKRDAKLLFAVLDRDGSAVISQDEFLDFGSILLLDFFQADDFAPFIQRRFPKLYNTPTYQRFVNFMKSDDLEQVINFILLLNAAVVVIQSWPLLVGAPVTLNHNYLDGTIDTVWELIEALFTGIYCLEAMLKIVAIGWRSYSERTRNVFDFLITILAFVATAYVYYPNQYSDSRVIRYIVMTRVLRLVRVIVSIKRFRVVGEIWYEIMPYATSVLTLLFVIMYIFAALGVELYGGLVTRDPSNKLSYLILNTDFSENDYWANNFNDPISAFNVLFNLLVVNNWTECEIGFEVVTKAKWVRFFFFAFHFWGVILVNNLVIAFFINAFLQQGEILNRRKTQLTVEGEAIIHGREASFDASEVTGTRTNLTGAFIARIRTNHAEEDEQDRLRRLFTQTSGEIRYIEKKRESEVMHFAHS